MVSAIVSWDRDNDQTQEQEWDQNEDQEQDQSDMISGETAGDPRFVGHTVALKDLQEFVRSSDVQSTLLVG